VVSFAAAIVFFVFFQTNLTFHSHVLLLWHFPVVRRLSLSRKRALATQLVKSVLSSTAPLLGLCGHETVLELPAPVLEKALESLVESRKRIVSL